MTPCSSGSSVSCASASVGLPSTERIRPYCCKRSSCQFTGLSGWCQVERGKDGVGPGPGIASLDDDALASRAREPLEKDIVRENRYSIRPRNGRLLEVDLVAHLDRDP